MFGCAGSLEARAHTGDWVLVQGHGLQCEQTDLLFDVALQGRIGLMKTLSQAFRVHSNFKALKKRFCTNADAARKPGGLTTFNDHAISLGWTAPSALPISGAGGQALGRFGLTTHS